MLETVLPGSCTRLFHPADLAELVVLQRCCWVQEAILNDTLDIPALHETPREVLAWAQSWTTVLARLDGRLVAAVRGRSEGEKWHVGRLMVAPDIEGRGVGAVLLASIERLAPTGTARFMLFTGGSSHRNIRFYRRAGYEIVDGSDANFDNHIKGAVYMSKSVGDSA